MCSPNRNKTNSVTILVANLNRSDKYRYPDVAVGIILTWFLKDWGVN
jgi:hypothetical protein